MTIRLINGAELLHIPKTGGTWITKVLEENNLVSGKMGHEHADYERNLLANRMGNEVQLVTQARQIFFDRLNRRILGKPGSQQVFRFCFVRHPLSWYESYWKFMNGRGWNDWGIENSANKWHPNSALNGLGSNDFNQFVLNVISKRPGYVTELFFSYAKPGISFVGKTEHMRQDLCYVLDRLNLKYDKVLIETKPKVNVSKGSKEQVEWDPQLKDLVMKLELPALLYFGYLSEHQIDGLGCNPEMLSKCRSSAVFNRESSPVVG